MAKPGYTGLRRIVHAAHFSALGLQQAWRYEAAFRQELALTAVLGPVAVWLGESPLETLLLIAPLILLLIVELLNSAVEAVVDRVGHEHHALSGRAKDMGSAAVLLSVGLLIAVWVTVLLPDLLRNPPA
ncbi:MAG: diacylglycerol kinase [Woeseia sp.]